MRTTPHDADDDVVPDDAGHGSTGLVEALWVHGMLNGLAEPPEAGAARLQKFVGSLYREGPQPTTRRFSPTIVRRAAAVVGLAAAVLVAVTFVALQSGSVQASTETLVREAQQAHRLPVDRCYLVQWESQPGSQPSSEPPALPKESRVWTRGDRFWFVTPGARHTACGRDEHGGIWVARSAHVGIRFDADEADVPTELALSCSLFSMQLDTLLSEVLRDFDLRFEASPAREAGRNTQTIRAELKSGHENSSVKTALLEIDVSTHAVQRLVVWRKQTMVTYTLVDTSSLADDQYTLEGHLSPDARIYTRSLNPELRRQKLRGG